MIILERFSYEANGYSRNEVNQFINDVITQTEGIVTKCKEQRREIDSLKAELEHYKRLESTLKNSILKAEETSDNIKRMKLKWSLVTLKVMLVELLMSHY